MNAPPMMTSPEPVKLTVDDFLLLDRSGAFSGYSKTELIDGTVYCMSPQHAEHFTVKNRLYRRIADVCDALETGLEAWSEGSIGMPANSVPEPDIFVTSERPVKGLVRPETVVLVIEVANTTLRFDLDHKARLYAAAGVPEYWVVDVEGRLVHLLWAAGSDGYAERKTVALGEPIGAVTIGGLLVETSGL